jgi:predicted peptidase
MRNGTSSLFARLTENDLTDFIPKAKLYMFHSDGDDYIPVNVAEIAYEYYKSVGGNVELIKSDNAATHRDTYYDYLKFVINKLK